MRSGYPVRLAGRDFCNGYANSGWAIMPLRETVSSPVVRYPLQAAEVSSAPHFTFRAGSPYHDLSGIDGLTALVIFVLPGLRLIISPGFLRAV